MNQKIYAKRSLISLQTISKGDMTIQKSDNTNTENQIHGI